MYEIYKNDGAAQDLLTWKDMTCSQHAISKWKDADYTISKMSYFFVKTCYLCNQGKIKYVNIYLFLELPEWMKGFQQSFPE